MRKMTLLILTMTCLLLVVSCSTPPPADIILLNGEVYTMEPDHPWASSVVITGNKITAVLDEGKNVDPYKGPDTRVIDMTGKFIVVVDEDIDPSDLDEVIWAIATRCDTETAMHTIPGFLDSGLDPSIPPHRRQMKDITMSKTIINACRPWHWKDKFPLMITAGKKLKTSVMKKWPEAFTHLNTEEYLAKELEE